MVKRRAVFTASLVPVSGPSMAGLHHQGHWAAVPYKEMVEPTFSHGHSASQTLNHSAPLYLKLRLVYF